MSRLPVSDEDWRDILNGREEEHKTPVTVEGLMKDDPLAPSDAVFKAWMDPGFNVGYHERMKREVRKRMPLLARALDRMSAIEVEELK